MGVVNVTPDSFSDGGVHLDPDVAANAARQMVHDGAAIVDIGGESTRPGAEGVSVEEELRRVSPVLERLAGGSSRQEHVVRLLLGRRQVVNERQPAEADVEVLRPWVEAAGEAGMYVVLDLQPGRTDFVTQAERYRSLLELPHVGLALDPEWRLGPGDVHLTQIGSVNPFAIEEHRELSTRLEDMSTQESDLRSAIGSTEELIGRLDTEIAQQFDTAFRAIAERFDEFCQLLFQHGDLVGVAFFLSLEVFSVFLLSLSRLKSIRDCQLRDTINLDEVRHTQLPYFATAASVASTP